MSNTHNYLLGIVLIEAIQEPDEIAINMILVSDKKINTVPLYESMECLSNNNNSKTIIPKNFKKKLKKSYVKNALFIPIGIYPELDTNYSLLGNIKFESKNIEVHCMALFVHTHK